MSLEAALAEHTAALKENTDILKQVVAGQKIAIAKVEETKGASTRRTATPKTETPAATPAAEPETPVAQAEPETPAAAEPEGRVVTNDEVKSAALAWMAAASKGADDAEKKKINAAIAGQLRTILDHFGRKGETLTGPENKLTPDENKQALFFVQRWANGLEVNFSEDYDFDGDPCQGGVPEAGEDPLG